jgi:hypothetical protein
MQLPRITFAGSQTTGQLQPGDLVITHGMRCLIDQDIVDCSYQGAPAAAGTVRWTAARVLNAPEVTEVPAHWLYESRWVEGTGWVSGADLGEDPRWTIQGNDWASWYVVRTA